MKITNQRDLSIKVIQKNFESVIMAQWKLKDNQISGIYVIHISLLYPEM